MHAPIAPSSMPQTVFCAGSVMMQMQFPQVSTDDSRAGDAVHEIAANVLKAYQGSEVGSELAYPHQILPTDYVGERDSAGTLITPEMADGAEVYTSHILRRANELGSLRSMSIEQMVQCPSIHPSACFGTPDHALWYEKTGTLYVDDLKYGHGFVDEFENWQNLTYASGKLDELNISGIDDQFINLELSIIQPRYYSGEPVRTWRLKASDLRGYVNTMQYQVQKALMPDAETRSGSQCRHCTGRRACPAARQSAYWAMEVSGQAMPKDITPGALGTELSYLQRGIKAMKYMETALLEQAESLVDDHVIVPGYARQLTKGNRRWKGSDEQVIQIGHAIGIELQEQKPISPAHAEKKGVDKVFVQAQTERPTSMKFKRVKDNSIKKVFSNET